MLHAVLAGKKAKNVLFVCNLVQRLHCELKINDPGYASARLDSP